jgi:hypothetical protein
MAVNLGIFIERFYRFERRYQFEVAALFIQWMASSLLQFGLFLDESHAWCCGSDLKKF